MRRIACLLLLALFALPSGATAQPADALARLQQRDAQLFSVGWKLARANAPFCRDTVPSIGLLLHDAASYGRPEEVRAALGLHGDIAVQAVAPGSPAAAAGLAADDTLTSVGSVSILAIPASDPAWRRLTELNDKVDAELALVPPAQVAWRDRAGAAHSAQIVAVPVCRSRFEVHDSGKRALAEGTRVIMGRDFPGFAYQEDEFAAAVAHELAHNLLGHRAWLDARGRGQAMIRLTERDADRMIPWLLHNAGYDPRAALRFMDRWGPEHGGGLLRKRTHDGWDERREFIAAEIATMEQAIADEGGADWSRHFRPESTDGAPQN